MKKLMSALSVLLTIMWLQAAASVSAQEGKIVPYVPTPQEVVDRMLELAQVKKAMSSTILVRATGASS